ncbi:MAG: GNAT family N-acetyltransferase [Candidatus Riflebacteria bacterium]
MTHINLHDREQIERFLRQNPHLHLYEIGDLDDCFWPHTIWYGSQNEAGIDAIALLYTGAALPTLLALADGNGAMAALLRSIRHILPTRFYAHLSPGLENVLRETYDCEPGGEHSKMALTDTRAVAGSSCAQVERLGESDLAEIAALYAESYPGNWFDPRMLATNRYFGIRESGRLVSIAGVHVYSPHYRVAALGNITTLPQCRGKGYGALVTAELCRSLLAEGLNIGLNVKTDNAAAIACYRKLGFQIVASYNEFTFHTAEGGKKGSNS